MIFISLNAEKADLIGRPKGKCIDIGIQFWKDNYFFRAAMTIDYRLLYIRKCVPLLYFYSIRVQ